MIGVAKKIYNIVKNHPEFNDQRVKDELRTFLDLNVLKDISSLYLSVSSNKKPIGNENKINSLTGYLLGLTKQKPTGELELKKRRTYGRSGFPDIDLDVHHYRRDEISAYLFEKYGRDRVANIGTIIRSTTKSCLQSTLTVLDPDNAIVFDKEGKKIKNDYSLNVALRHRISNTIPNNAKTSDGKPIKTIKDAYKTFPEFRRCMDAYPEVYRVAQHMEGGIKTFGSHAAGFVISPVSLAKISPMHVTKTGADRKTKTLATQFVASEVEALGLIKFDILGLLTKTVIQMATNLITERQLIDIDVDNLPLDDPVTLSFLQNQRLDGIFQLEEPGMQRTIKEIGIDSFDDLAVAIAMYRPGPLQFIPEYARRKRLHQSIRYLHPIIKKYTKNTYSIIVYQEQAMQIFVELAGLSNYEGYVFIKGSAKKDPELFMSMKQRFIEGATKKSSREIAEKVWKQMEPFQGYAFSMSHAYSYAYESWKTAYLKAHYPLEFMTARLSVAALDRKFEDVEKFERDCAYNGITIEPPDLNKSKMHYAITGKMTIRRPIIIKGIGDKAAEEIVARQPYKKADILESFAIRTINSTAINTSVIDCMYDIGLLDKSRSKEKSRKYFESVRTGHKKAKGRQTGDLFE